MNVRFPGVENSATHMEEVARPLDGMKWLGIKNRRRQQQPRRHGDTVGGNRCRKSDPHVEDGGCPKIWLPAGLGRLVGGDVGIWRQQQGGRSRINHW